MPQEGVLPLAALNANVLISATEFYHKIFSCSLPERLALHGQRLQANFLREAQNNLPGLAFNTFPLDMHTINHYQRLGLQK